MGNKSTYLNCSFNLCDFRRNHAIQCHKYFAAYLAKGGYLFGTYLDLELSENMKI